MIEVTNLSKRFGTTYAVNKINMQVGAGDIYGFIGHNGAGKSTTFRILATILRPDTGTATIDGVPLSDGDRIRSLIGYMPDMFGVYEDMTVMQYLDFFGAAYFLPRQERRKLIGDILELTDLTFKKDEMVKTLSRGMSQRLGIARVLVHDPKVLILDEPASGLDPRARIELRELLKELAAMGKTILISSHILSELSEICTRVGMIESGRFLFEGTRDELNDRLAHLRDIKIDVHPDDRAAALAHLQSAAYTNEVTLQENGRLFLMPHADADRYAIAGDLTQSGIRLGAVEPTELTLEDAFMSLSGGQLA